MSDPMPTVRDILGMPEFSAKVTPIRPQAVSGPTAVQFTPPPVFEPDEQDDDLQSAGDELRDHIDETYPYDDDPAEPWREAHL